ncbi:MAG: TnsA endonuclease N-terminal domain-containing protein [Atribacterota bacterium]|nr:TnsA endonuclease N-terminal domain-containing protein [Atribacterota bacterium]
MSKRKRISSVEKNIKNGRGQGIGVSYQPYIKIQDVPSLGRSSRLKGNKVPRQFDFLSDLERNFFYLLEFSDHVIDIKEQYSLLPVEETMSIADELGIKHPRDRKTGEYFPMTTDFLITYRNHDGEIINLARTLKYKQDLLDERTLEKFEIERVYWEKKDIDWGIVTELEIPKIMTENISYVSSYYNLFDKDGFEKLNSEDISDICKVMVDMLVDEKITVNAIAKKIDKNFGLLSGCGLSIFKYMLANKIISIDLKNKINLNEIVKIQINETGFYPKVESL